MTEEIDNSSTTPQETTKQLPKLSKKLLFLFSFACFAVVGNLYYAQPLLVDMGKDLNKGQSSMGLATTSAQIGYAVGLFGITPLGDMLPRKKILVVLGYLVSVSLLITGFSVSFIMLCVASVFMGILTVMAQIIVPLAADLTDPKEQGKTIGVVMSGLLLGILLSRTISGWVGLWLGWRAVYWGASIIMTATTILLHVALPVVPVTSSITYVALLRSLWHLLRTQPRILQAGILGATVFGSFSCFWTTITFRLSTDPYNYNSGVIGLFSLIGVAGIVGSPLGGFLVDKKGNMFTMGIALAIVFVNMVILTFLDNYLVALILAMFFYDMGVQTCQVCNQQRIYSLVPKSKSRVNGIYMVMMFTGGAIGSAVGSAAYGRWGWRGSGITALILLSISVVAYFAFPEKYCGALPKPQKQNEKDIEAQKINDDAYEMEREQEIKQESDKENEKAAINGN